MNENFKKIPTRESLETAIASQNQRLEMAERIDPDEAKEIREYIEELTEQLDSLPAETTPQEEAIDEQTETKPQPNEQETQYNIPGERRTVPKDPDPRETFRKFEAKRRAETPEEEQ